MNIIYIYMYIHSLPYPSHGPTRQPLTQGIWIPFGSPCWHIFDFLALRNALQILLRKTSKKPGKCWMFSSQNRSQTPSKSNQNRRPQKHRNFHWFSIDFGRLLQKPNHDFVRMAIVFVGFYTIDAFACGMRFGSHNHAKNPSKTRSEPFKNRCQKYVVFYHRFSEVSASIWEGLGPPRWSQVGNFGL